MKSFGLGIVIWLCILFNYTKAAWTVADNGYVCRSQCLKKRGSESDSYKCTTEGIVVMSMILSMTTSTCSPTKGLGNGKSVLTKTGEYCITDCAKNKGTSYNWCYTYGNWDYCDPDSIESPQYLTRWGEYCKGPCTKIGKDYYWCAKLNYSGGRWDYCSPAIGKTRYDLQCKSNHTCAKYEKNYYWCYVESNGFGWTWDYCSPSYDINEALSDDELNFSGNFETYGETERNTPLSSGQTISGTGLTTNRGQQPSRDHWKSYPYLYRILSSGRVNERYREIDEGAGARGIKSRMLHFHLDKPNIKKRIGVPDHVTGNPDRTPWISTSSYFEQQHGIIEREVEGQRADRYLVTINAKCLDRENTIVNLANSAVGNELLSSNEKAKAYARTFELILVYWNIPPTAVVRCRRYFYDPVSKVVNFEEMFDFVDDVNCSGTPKHEDFNDEDNSDNSNYP